MTNAQQSSADACNAEMKALEAQLLHTDYSIQPDLLDKLLALEFEEISANGQVSKRAAVYQWLLHKDRAARWQLSNFKVTELATTLRLATYHAQQVAPVASASKGALCSSLWCFSQPLQCWQLRFHQATKVL